MPLLQILAEAAAGGESTMVRDIGAVASMISGFGFAVWYAWYMTTSRIPAIEKTHADQLAESRKDYRDQLRDSEQRHEQNVMKMIDNFRADQTAMWAIKREDDQRLAQAIDRLSECIGENRCQYIHAQRP
jgi:hypothetical protein